LAIKIVTWTALVVGRYRSRSQNVIVQ